MHLALDVSWTQVENGMAIAGSWVGRHYPDVGLFEDIARIAERGLFDMISRRRHRHPECVGGGDRRQRCAGGLPCAAPRHEPVDHGDVASDRAMLGSG